MKTFKDKRRTHNRPAYGPFCWYSGNKENRKLMKGLRHKLLFHIPLTDEEKWIVEKTGLTATSQLDGQWDIEAETLDKFSEMKKSVCEYNVFLKVNQLQRIFKELELTNEIEYEKDLD